MNNLISIVPVTIFGVTFDRLEIGSVILDEQNKIASWTARVISDEGSQSISHSFSLVEKEFDEYYFKNDTPGIVDITFKVLGIKKA